MGSGMIRFMRAGFLRRVRRVSYTPRKLIRNARLRVTKLVVGIVLRVQADDW